MIKILRGNGRLAGTVFSELDMNFIEVCNALLKLAAPGHELKGYADHAGEPASPVKNNCYLVQGEGTVWELTVEKNDIICYNGAAWELLPWKITELNTAIQALFFEAENIAFTPPGTMNASNVQDALEELAAALFGVNGGTGESESSSGSGSA